MANDTESDLRNPYAERSFPDSGQRVLPEEAIYKLNYYCPDPLCLDPNRRLFLKKRQRYFFSHYKGYDHLYSGETLLHKLSIKYFQKLESFEAPSLNGNESFIIKIDTTQTKLEYNGFKNLRPDIKITSIEDDTYFIEIFVTHETKGKKLNELKEYNLPTIEIELNDFYYQHQEQCRINVEFVRNEVPTLISNIALKKWLYHPDIVQEITESAPKEEQVSIEVKPNQPAMKNSSSGWSTSDKIKFGAAIGTFAFIVSPSLRKILWKKIKSWLGKE